MHVDGHKLDKDSFGWSGGYGKVIVCLKKRRDTDVAGREKDGTAKSRDTWTKTQTG